MGSSVQFENNYAEDVRWIEAGPAAFALHFAACCYADRMNTDGKVPKVMVPRVALAVAAEQVDAAVAALLKAGFWTSSGNSYQVVRYVEDKIGLSAEEKLMNRERWAEDKRWRRRHQAGNHSICPPDKCREASKDGGVSQSDSLGTPSKSPKRVQGVSHRTTRPDSLRLDSTRLDYGVGGESESEGRPSGSASAGAPAALQDEKPRERPEVATAENLGVFGFDVASLSPEEVSHIVSVLNEPRDGDETLDGLVDAESAATSR